MSPLIPVLSLAGCVVVAVMRVTDSLLPLIAEEFQVSVGSAGMVVTSFALGYGLFLLLYGPLGDRHGKLRVVSMTLSVAALCVVGCAFATSLPMLAVLRFMTGMTTAATVPLSLAWIGDHVPLENRQATIARYMGGVIFGQMVGAGLGGILADQMGWRSIFLFFGFAMGLVAIFIWRAARQATNPRLAPPISLLVTLRNYLALARDPKAADLLTAAFIEGLCVFGSVAYIGAMLHHNFGLSFTVIGLMMASYGAGGLVYSATAPRLIPWLGRQGMVMMGGAFMAWSLVTLTAVPVWSAAPPLIMLLGLGFYMLHSTLQTLATELLPGARGTSFALFAFALFAGQSVGVTALGMLIDSQGYKIALGSAGVMVGLLGLWLRNSPAITRYGRG